METQWQELLLAVRRNKRIDQVVLKDCLRELKVGKFDRASMEQRCIEAYESLEKLGWASNRKKEWRELELTRYALGAWTLHVMDKYARSLVPEETFKSMSALKRCKVEKLTEQAIMLFMWNCALKVRYYLEDDPAMDWRQFGTMKRELHSRIRSYVKAGLGPSQDLEQCLRDDY